MCAGLPHGLAGAVHPRACGEHGQGVAVQDDILGSSPRLRGTSARRRRSCKFHRFIPAPAGNMQAVATVTVIPTVHPRACGEHEKSGGDEVADFGSSPRLRGTLGMSVCAYAGMSVHPRACGEHLRTALDHDFPLGSSPRLRGTLSTINVLPDMCRFIPAPAGNICQPGFAESRTTVHPRACGEHASGNHTGQGYSGSSPRLRGTSAGHAHPHRAGRFIPAPAGNIGV